MNGTQVATKITQAWSVGLASPIGRPATGPVSTFPKELEEAILHLRALHPGWGPTTLLAAFKTDAYWCNQPLPSRAQLARLLKAESYPSLETTNPALPDYQLSLRRAFLMYGLPQTLTASPRHRLL